MKPAQPIPYQGSKRLQAPKIMEFLPANFNRLVEPFAGSAAFSYAVATSKPTTQFLINDLNRPLVNLLYKIIELPEEISANYERIWTAQLGNEKEYFKNVRSLFNEEQRSEYLLYLLARCVKGAVRYNNNGEFNQSPDNRRLGRKPTSMKKEIFKFSNALKGKCNFKSLSYVDLFDYLDDGDIIYMDPPYQGTSSKRDNRYLQGLAVEDFIKSLRTLNEMKIPYLFSYDGKLGDKEYGVELPKDLNLERHFIANGRSTTSTLNGGKEETIESLYISKALRTLNGRKVINKCSSQIELNFA